VKAKPFILFGLSVVLLFAAAAYAMTIKVLTDDGSGVYCTDLIAGQKLDIGDVCVTADNEFVYIAYEIDSDNAWYLDETHLWVGQDIADLPVNRKGNPAIGNFPYGYSGIDSKSWVQQVSLFSLGLTVEDICLQDVAVLFAAHASVVMYGDGIVTAQETAWANGEQINEGGSWAMYDQFLLTCDHGEEVECETAWGHGPFELDDYIKTSRWGWFSEQKMNGGEYYRYPIYAAAGNNDPANGYQVGEVGVQYGRDCGVWVVAYVYPEYKMTETHLFAEHFMPTTAAPGQFGREDYVTHTLEMTNGAAVAYRIAGEFSGDNIFTAFHAVVCERENDE